jgi:LmbE family N-acetylglucosaminyl deacetylase
MPSSNLRLCAFFAHPDDESFSAGGALARYADEGVAVTLVTATSGEAGEIAPGLDVRKEELGAWREQELRRAAEILGVSDLRVLHLPDGDLAGHGGELFAAYIDVLRELRPHVSLTEDIQGITGHPDHIAVTNALRQAFDAVADGPLKLYEHVVPQSVFAGRPQLRGTPEDYITTRVDVTPWRERLADALRAHGSQVSDEMLRRRTELQGPWIDHYVCVRSRVPILIPEDDLFSGIPRT